MAPSGRQRPRSSCASPDKDRDAPPDPAKQLPEPSPASALRQHRQPRSRVPARPVRTAARYASDTGPGSPPTSHRLSGSSRDRVAQAHPGRAPRSVAANRRHPGSSRTRTSHRRPARAADARSAAKGRPTTPRAQLPASRLESAQCRVLRRPARPCRRDSSHRSADLSDRLATRSRLVPEPHAGSPGSARTACDTYSRSSGRQVSGCRAANRRTHIGRSQRTDRRCDRGWTSRAPRPSRYRPATNRRENFGTGEPQEQPSYVQMS